MTLSMTSPFHTCLHWSRKTTVWIWVKESDDGSQQAGVMDPAGSSWWDRGGESQGECVQMALGTPGQWRKAPCSGRYLFICENDVTSKLLIHWCQIIRSDKQYIETVKIQYGLFHPEFLPSGDTYLTGLVLMTGVYTETQIKLLPNIPDLGHQTVEVSFKL